MRIASIGHAVFSATMIGLGIVGLLHRDFVPVWNPVPASVPAREPFLYLGALISLTSGIGLLVPRMTTIAARLLLATLLLWLLLFRLPNFFHAPPFAACWPVFPIAVMLAAAWVLYVWFAADWDRKHLSFIISSNNGLRIARVLYGFSLIFFGVAHFIDVKDTLSLIPHWLPAHLFWAYFTGCAFVAAGVSVSRASMYEWQPPSPPCKLHYSCFWYGYPSWQQAPKFPSSGARRFLTRRSWLPPG